MARPINVDGDAFAASMLGLCVERVTANIPQSTNTPIFTVSGGAINVFGLFGRVTTIIQAQANLTKVTSVPTVGSSVDLCTTTDITGLEVGGWLVVGLSAVAALGKTLAGAAFSAYGFISVAAGTINLNCAASNTGQVRWTLFWTPLDTGASVAFA